MHISIGHKIAFLYSAITLCAAGLVFVVVFYWMSDYSDNICYSFLEERAYLIAQKKMDKDKAKDSYDHYLRNKEDGTLPSTSLLILDADNKRITRNVLKNILTDGQINDLYNMEQIRFKTSSNLGVAIYAPNNEGNFIVVVTAGHRLSSYIYRQLGYWLCGCVFLCLLLITLVSKLYALHRINSLNEAYLREKQFVHHASHELSNPLTAIQGECEISLLRKRTAAEYEMSLKRIGSEAKRMGEIIHQLLYLANATDNLQSTEAETLPLAQFLTQFTEKRVRLDVEPECAGTNVTANPYLLRIAIKNIINNALKYSSDIVILHLKERVLTITDHGIGIPKEDMPYIAQPFYRAKNVEDRKGNGIGLSLAFRILGLYHIKIKITSEQNKGTTVLLKFPKI